MIAVLASVITWNTPGFSWGREIRLKVKPIGGRLFGRERSIYGAFAAAVLLFLLRGGAISYDSGRIYKDRLDVHVETKRSFYFRPAWR